LIFCGWALTTGDWQAYHLVVFWGLQARRFDQVFNLSFPVSLLLTHL
jgi:hypothetical protein